MTLVREAFRSLLRTPLPTFVVVITLAITIGSTTAIWTVADGVLRQPIGYQDEDRLVVVWGSTDPLGSSVFRLSPADYRDLRDDADSFNGQVALYRSIGSTLTGGDRPARVGTFAVTPRLFEVLDAQPLLGRFFSYEDETPGSSKKLVLTEASWRRRFAADPNIVGKTLELDDVTYTVVGVTAPGFHFPPGDDEVEMYFPMVLGDAILLDRDHRMFDAVARLADGVSVSSASEELEAIADRLAREYPETNQGWYLTVAPLRGEILGDLAPTLWALLGAVLIVLLIACANIANVLIARAARSGGEYAVRSALGAQKEDLLLRSLAESTLLGTAGGFAGLVVALLGIAVLEATLPGVLGRLTNIGASPGTAIVTACLALGATLLFAALPALRAMRPDLAGVLSASGTSRRVGTGRIRELFVVAQVALAIVLLVAAVLVLQSFTRLARTDPGFDPGDVTSVVVQLPTSRYSRVEWKPFFERVIEEVGELPGVQTVGAVSDLPMSSVGLGFEVEFTVPGLEALSPTARPNADFRFVAGDYFEAMDMAITSGRAFDTGDALGERVVAVVNETLARRYFADLDPLGRVVDTEILGEITVVGIVDDVSHRGLLNKHESEIYVPFGRLATREMHVVVESTLGTEAVAGGVSGVLSSIDSQLAPTRVEPVADLVWESIARPRFLAALLACLSLCAAVLAAIGIYGIVSYAVAVRTAEIGLRMALGADARATLRWLVARTVLVVVAGSVLGVLGAIASSRFVGRLLHDLAPIDPLVYALTVLAACTIAAAAASLPALRAVKIDPVAALREGSS